ncbi:MAG: hypothetical protein KGJ89_00885 [Patescibacteria group bacterium]|nr:hypothetical protein [Patescibacteria group bacterium]MDE2015068.1 hypothetical protein [Patescibacteria group bacterium]MDE2226496.1 hypothetical protein [Patescibacteria group bacterium]
MEFSRFRFIVVSFAVVGMLFLTTAYYTHEDAVGYLRGTMTIFGQTTVTIHCHASLTEAVAAGKYHEVNKYIDEEDFPSYHFACMESEEVMHLMEFDRGIRGDEAIKRLDMAGFRPADLRELLAFGEMRSVIYRDSTIVALGSTMRGMDLSSYLYSDQYGQNIGLHGDGETDIILPGYKWHTGDLFLAIRK